MFIYIYIYIYLFFNFFIFLFKKYPLERMRVDGGAEHAAPNDTL